jgi:hypothetical protein
MPHRATLFAFRNVTFGAGVLWLLLAGSPLTASTVRLTCTADITEESDAKVSELGLRPAALLNFRFDPVRKWRIDKVTLMVHLARGEAPQQLDVAIVHDKWSEKKPASRHRYAFLIHTVNTEADGWLSVPLRQPIVDDLLGGKVWGLALSGPPTAHLSSRESITFAPYLLVEGRAPAPPHTEPAKPASAPPAPAQVPVQKLRH